MLSHIIVFRQWLLLVRESTWFKAEKIRGEFFCSSLCYSTYTTLLALLCPMKFFIKFAVSKSFQVSLDYSRKFFFNASMSQYSPFSCDSGLVPQFSSRQLNFSTVKVKVDIIFVICCGHLNFHWVIEHILLVKINTNRLIKH